MARNLLSIDDLTPAELDHLLDLSAEVKAVPGSFVDRLRNLSVAMIFEKPSTRTRVSFEVAAAAMGAHPLILSPTELQLGRGETIEDTGRVMSRYVDCIVLRTFGQERLEDLAKAATKPVINALSDFEHPCQCLADLLTIKEWKGKLRGLTLTYIGDGNNVAHALLLGGAKSGMTVRVATPVGFEPIPQVVQRAKELAAESGCSIEVTNAPAAAVDGADVIYTDVWASMGQEAEKEARAKIFAPYQVNAALFAAARPDAIFMHCLPAHREEEVSAEIFESYRSVVFDEAENRLHVQKAVLVTLMGDGALD